VFGPKVAIFSNTAGSGTDIGYKSALEIEKTLGIAVIRHQEQVILFFHYFLINGFHPLFLFH
jgi:hypothetical protein